MLENIFTVTGLISLLTLVLMEIVLGIDNVIFISILCGKLPREEQGKARRIGLSLALLMRIGLLLAITWIISFKEPLFTILSIDLSGKDIILLSGGLFLMYSSTKEIHQKMEGEEEEDILNPKKKKHISLSTAIVQIIFLDIIFSFDSILTAVGMVQDNVLIMILAVIISMVIMLFFSGKVSDFVNNHPAIKMLALTFLLMIGMLLVAEAVHFHVPKGYIYFAMGFSLVIELMNMRVRKKSKKKVTES